MQYFFVQGILAILFLLPPSGTNFIQTVLEAVTETSSEEKVSPEGVSDLPELNILLRQSLTTGDAGQTKSYVDRILQLAQQGVSDSSALSESYYLIGVFELISGNPGKGIEWLTLAGSVIERNGKQEELYARTLYNIGVGYNSLGDYEQMSVYTQRSVEIERKLFGSDSPSLVQGLSSLVTASIELQQYDRAVAYGNEALDIINKQSPGIFPARNEPDLYLNLGVCYYRLSDYSKSVLYLEKAESFYSAGNMVRDEKYINLLNSLAVTYGYLGQQEKSIHFYRRGMEIAEIINSSLAYNFINSYAIALGNSGMIAEGQKIHSSLLERVGKLYGRHSGPYVEVLKNFAEYLRIYSNDPVLSLLHYEECLRYTESHPDEPALRDPVMLGYALALSANHQNEKALDMITRLSDQVSGSRDGTDATSLKADQKSLLYLRARYSILKGLYSESGRAELLLETATTSEEIIRLLERIRINISEEESRLILGDRYRDSYLMAINDFYLCFKESNDQEYLKKIFEYSEKSKVAGLLTATRELKAVQFHIPPGIAELERGLQRSINYYNAKIADENLSINPDASLLQQWNSILLNVTMRRDSLISVLENKYPEYYSIRYNTEVAGMKKIHTLIGRNANYLNYIVSDSVIYLFVANRKHQQFLSFPVDSAFFKQALEFRSLLSLPSPSANARSDFKKYCKTAHELFLLLVEPAKPFLISDKLIISPDNILSFLPFETFLYEEPEYDDMLYRELPYAMKEYEISYIYSATMLAESLKRKISLNNSLVSIAPSYKDRSFSDSILFSRQGLSGSLPDLPFAREEAEYVAQLTRGDLFLNGEASEKLFKSMAGNYDIVHLAMHTLLNDRMPMHSKMIFSVGESEEDGFLNTYEIYGIPLKAKMVVLSSCNTGVGLSYSGEGILSLARGFIYSGSESVIMSLWEIEDRSGTEIVKEFYRNLKKGNSKSNALRRARVRYMKNADQLRSHPYFWSSLVVYGNNFPVYQLRQIVTVLAASVISALIAFIIYRRSR